MIYRNNTLDNAYKFVSNPGDRFETIYEPKVQKDGSIELIPSGKKDVQQEIDSWREHTDMAYVLRQMAAGTYEPRTHGMYADFTEMPDNLIEAYQIMIDGERAFYDLDLETRNKFNNNWREWLFSMHESPEEFNKKMNFIEEVKEEVKTEVIE